MQQGVYLLHRRLAGLEPRLDCGLRLGPALLVILQVQLVEVRRICLQELVLVPLLDRRDLLLEHLEFHHFLVKLDGLCVVGELNDGL